MLLCEVSGLGPLASPSSRLSVHPWGALAQVRPPGGLAAVQAPVVRLIVPRNPSQAWAGVRDTISLSPSPVETDPPWDGTPLAAPGEQLANVLCLGGPGEALPVPWVCVESAGHSRGPWAPGRLSAHPTAASPGYSCVLPPGAV